MDGDRQYSYNGEASSNGEPGGTDLISIEQLRHLVRLLDRSDVSELEVKRVDEGTRLVLRKAKMPELDVSGNSQAGAWLNRETESISTGTDSISSEETRQVIVAPLVGVFHSWAKPKGGAVVAVGDSVKVGQLVGTIQSLNVINEVESTIEGHVVEILVQDGQPVEYGQPLMTIDVRGGV